MKYVWKTFERGKTEWFTLLTNSNICIFESYALALKEEKSQLNCMLRL